MKLLREPLLHFLVAGAALFGAYAWLDRGEESADGSRSQPVHIGEGDVRWLRETWTRQWRREPTHAELHGLVADLLKEQLLAREARELKLDENDIIVRRRLAQKLTFLIEDTLRLAEPTENDLQQIYAANLDRFKTDARVSFMHVYFNPTGRDDPVSDAKRALLELSEADGTERAGFLGDRSLLEPAFHDVNEPAVAAVFGPDFARAVLALTPGAWSGPIASGYGLHLVRVSALREPQARPLAEVRAQVLEEWRREQGKAANEQYLAGLRSKYDVSRGRKREAAAVGSSATTHGPR